MNILTLKVSGAQYTHYHSKQIICSKEYYELVDATYSGYVLPDVFEVHVCTRVIHH